MARGSWGDAGGAAGEGVYLGGGFPAADESQREGAQGSGGYGRAQRPLRPSKGGNAGGVESQASNDELFRWAMAEGSGVGDVPLL